MATKRLLVHHIQYAPTMGFCQWGIELDLQDICATNNYWHTYEGNM